MFLSPTPLPWHHLVVPAQARQERQIFQKGRSGEGRLYKVSKMARKQGQEVEGIYNVDPQN